MQRTTPAISEPSTAACLLGAPIVLSWRASVLRRPVRPAWPATSAAVREDVHGDVAEDQESRDDLRLEAGQSRRDEWFVRWSARDEPEAAAQWRPPPGTGRSANATDGVRIGPEADGPLSHDGTRAASAISSRGQARRRAGRSAHLGSPGAIEDAIRAGDECRRVQAGREVESPRDSSHLARAGCAAAHRVPGARQGELGRLRRYPKARTAGAEREYLQWMRAGRLDHLRRDSPLTGARPARLEDSEGSCSWADRARPPATPDRRGSARTGHHHGAYGSDRPCDRGLLSHLTRHLRLTRLRRGREQRHDQQDQRTCLERSTHANNPSAVLTPEPGDRLASATHGQSRGRSEITGRVNRLTPPC